MRKLILRSVVIAACASILVGIPANAGDNKKKDKDIRKLLEVTQGSELGMQMMDQMIDAMKLQMPQVSDAFWVEFRKEVNGDELIDMIVPIYSKYFTHDDIKALLEFYDTPVGKKFIAVQGDIMTESMEAGQQWGQQVAVRAIMRLQSKAAEQPKAQ